MKNRKKQIRTVVWLTEAVFSAAVFVPCAEAADTSVTVQVQEAPVREENPAKAEKAAAAYAQAVDYEYKTPEKIYALMSDEYQKSISEEDFCEAFLKERSYPYLTPLFIYLDYVELSEDQTEGTAYYSRAARLPGMTYEVRLVLQDGDYKIEDFEELADGTYLEKFKTVEYDLSSYFDLDELKKEQ